jgi:YgjP-like, metallopeptidase domain
MMTNADSFQPSTATFPQRPVPHYGSGPHSDPGDFRHHQEPAGLLTVMTETIQLGAISIAVMRKDIKNVDLSVHPPNGRVTLSAPSATRLEVARAYAISKLSWIRDQQKKLTNQARETPRQFITRESHSLWGRRHLMTVIYRDAKPFAAVDHKRIILPCARAAMRTSAPR